MTKKETLEAALRGEGCLGRCQDDEPVFVLVARDLTAAKRVRNWADEAELLGTPLAKVREANLCATHMDVWRKEHGGGKVPD